MDNINNDKQESSEGPDIKMSPEQPGIKDDVAVGDLIIYEDVDPVLAAKMHLLNQVFDLEKEMLAPLT